MKTLFSGFCFLFTFITLASAGDYTIVRDVETLPGGTTNVVKIYPRPSGWSAEVIEAIVWGGATDTVSVSRVSCNGAVTNAIVVMSVPGPTSVQVTSSNFTALAYSTADYVLVSATGTNCPKVSIATRVHSGEQ